MLGRTRDVHSHRPRLTAKRDQDAEGGQEPRQPAQDGGGGGAADEQHGRAAQPGQAEDLVLEAPVVDLPHGVVGVLEGADQAEPRPQQAEETDDRRRLAALLGGVTASVIILALSPCRPSWSTIFPATSVWEPAATNPRTASATRMSGKSDRKAWSVKAAAS